MYDKQYLGSWDIPDGGIVATISRCEQGSIPIVGTPRKERKPLLYFEGQEKPMILNATNMKAVAGLYGFEVSAWRGQQVELVVALVQDNKGNMVNAIRISPRRPAQVKPTPRQPTRRQPAPPAPRELPAQGIPDAEFDDEREAIAEESSQ